jgi:hypothetical protein
MKNHRHTRESINRPLMDIQDVNMWNLIKNIYFSTYPSPTLTHLSHRFTSVSKPAAQKSFNCWLGHFRTWSGIICYFRTSLREFLDPVVNRFTRQTLPTVNRNISLWISYTLSPFAHKKRTTERCSSVVHSSTVAILTTKTSLWTCTCASAT